MSTVNNIEKLRAYIRPYVEKGVCIAFSGGVDSTLLLKTAVLEAKCVDKQVYAVTFQTKLHPSADMEETETLARELEAVYQRLEIDEFQDEELLQNPVDRCYICKKMLFQELQAFSRERGCAAVLDGTNVDDLKEYRPGRKALGELGIVSPLMELGFTKAQVREMAKELGLSVHNKPSMPCLATRLPYGTRFDFELLQRINQGEEFIRERGFYNVRLRLHGDIARVEVDSRDMMKLIAQKDVVIEKLKELGFLYVTMDLEGFRSGSMDVKIVDK